MRKVKQAHGGTLTLAEKGDVLNPAGPSRKLTSKIIADLKEDGVEVITPNQVSEAISVLLNLTMDDLKKLAEDKDVAVLIRRTARRLAIASDKEWDKVISDNLDRAHGKPAQAVDVTSKGQSINPLSELSLERQAEILRLMRNADT